MKKYLIAIALVILTAGSTFSGIFDKGSRSFGGGFSLTNYNGDAYSDLTVITIAPKLTFGTGNGLFYGGFLELQSYSAGGNSNTDVLIGVIQEYYFGSAVKNASKGKVVPRVNAMVGIGRNDDVTLFSFGVNIGFLVLMADYGGFDAGIGYNLDRFSANSVSISGGRLEAQAGFSYFIF